MANETLKKDQCTAIDCVNESHTKGLCQRHYNAWYRKQNHARVSQQKLEWASKNKELVKERALANRIKNREKINAQKAVFRLENRDKIRMYMKEWRDKNRKRYRDAQRKYEAKNIEKERIRSREKYRKDKKAANERVAARRARRLKAMPQWLTKEQRKEMYVIYRNRPDGYHVDHIVPLQGRNVSGLHVPWNLQYLPAAENLKKNNKYE